MIAEVASAIGKEGISKVRKNEKHNYNFRGIDDIYNSLSGLLSETGLVIIPSYEERECVERSSSSGNALFYVSLKGTYRFISSKDGSETIAGPFFGEAMDSGDKATNKAMSAAYKYMAMQVFAIPTEGDNDADKTSHAVKPKITPAAGAEDGLTPEQIQACKELSSNIQELVNSENQLTQWAVTTDTWEADQKVFAWSLLPSNIRSAIKKLQKEKQSEQAKHNQD